MRYAVLGAALLLVAACGAYQFPGGSASPSTGNVSGRVITVPCSPVQPAPNACTGRAAAGMEITFTAGQNIRRTTADSNGQYSIDLEPGTYKVTFKTYMRVINGRSSITVAAGDKIVADYVLDNGIRAPVPQA